MSLYPNKEGLLNESPQQAAERLAGLVQPMDISHRLGEPQERPHCFVSGLSAREFALAAGDDIASLGVVTGSSVYHIGWQWAPLYESKELVTVTQAELQVRMRALARLQQEAARMDAHGIIDIRFQNRDMGRDVVEFSAIGTAIRLTQGQPPPRPFLTTLSAGEFWTLRRAGYRPCGVALGVCAFYHVASVPLRNLRFTRRGRQIGRKKMTGIEYTEYTEAIQSVRQTAMDRLVSQARQGMTEGIIGLQLDHKIAPPPTDDNKYRPYDLVIRFVALGTAITPHRDRWPLLDYAVSLTD